MKKLLIITLILSAQAAFAWTNKDFRIANKNIVVGVYDDATNGCWTNLGEVKRYVEDKLSIAGANIRNEHTGLVHPDNNNYWYTISVIGYRLNNGVCIGSISGELYAAVRFSEFHFAYVQSETMLLNSTNGSNLNNQVLSVASDFIRKLN